ncbi:MAG: hypothetical protein M3Z98_04845 [Candidatus Dormibacteraeota bacterium]|nr:hypothetical protein [Candidatus Dormibacteraeota bacterium]
MELRRLIRERLTQFEHEQENLKTVLNDPVLLTRHLAKLLELRDLEQRHSH